MPYLIKESYDVMPELAWFMLGIFILHRLGWILFKNEEFRGSDQEEVSNYGLGFSGFFLFIYYLFFN